MPRQSRTKSESGIYHVMFRGNNQQVIFEDDFDRMKFISLLSEFQENEGRGCFTLYSYCLMDELREMVGEMLPDDVNCMDITLPVTRLLVRLGCRMTR